MERYSPSKIKSFYQCKLQYYLHYRKGITVDWQHQDTRFGSCFHECAQIWDGIHKEPLKEIVRAYNLDAVYRREIVSAVQNYFNFNEYYKIFESHLEIPIEIKTDQYWLYGIIDRLIIGKYGLLVIDYKTARKADRDRHLFQMQMYTLILYKLYNIPIEYLKCMVYYPRLNYKDEFSMNVDDIINVERYIIDSINEIEACIEWPANKSRLCDWCQYHNTNFCR